MPVTVRASGAARRGADCQVGFGYSGAAGSSTVSTRLAHLTAIGAFVVLAVATSWPLPIHLGTHLTGPPSGDAGVYVWNIWVFHAEVSAGDQPFFTDKVFPLTSGIDLTLHNYTAFANALAFPLVDRVGVVAAFNLVYLFLVALNGYAAYVLARYVTRRHLESWIAGAVFAVSPVLVARSTAHLSLIAAAPLPLFVLALVKAIDTGRQRYAALAGLAIAWAAVCDAYYPVYCVLLAAAILTGRVLAVRFSPRPAAGPRLTWLRAYDLLLVCLAGLVVGIAASRGWRFELFGRPIAIVTLYTPVFVLTVLVLVRIALALRPALSLRRGPVWRQAVALGALIVLAAALPLSPMLVAAGQRLRDGSFVRPSIFWRSSPPGVDVVNFVLPNPSHPWLGERSRAWLTRDRADHLAEMTASIPLVVLAVVGLAWWRGALPRRGLIITAGAALLALGPFIHVAGYNTYVPGPWALARYLPVVGLARSPSRFTVVVTLCVAMLFALAFAHLRDTTRRRRLVTLVVAALVAFELAPVPRTLYSAAIPAIYEHVRDDPDTKVRVLELPVGIRDGTKSVGDFSAASQFHQTYHGKAVVGGYLSRVSKRRIERTERFPVMKALLALSGGRPLGEGDAARALESRDRFLEATRVGWVVVDRSRASEALEQCAVVLFDLVKVDEEGDLVLYRPTRHAFSPQPRPHRPGR